MMKATVHSLKKKKNLDFSFDSITFNVHLVCAPVTVVIRQWRDRIVSRQRERTGGTS